MLPSSPTARNDCLCKEYLEPTAPTFDVIPSNSDRHSMVTPHIATISSDGIYYRGGKKRYLALKPKKYVFLA
jgi:hypothetical protein